MDITVKYFDKFDNIITEEQTKSLKDYRIYIYYDGCLKIEEYYYQAREIKGKRTNYYLDESEDKNSIIERYTDEVNNDSCSVFFKKQSDGQNSLWEREDYSKESILKSISEVVFDQNMRTIANIDYFLGTSEFKSAYKYVYSNLNEIERYKDILFEFKYKESGKLIHIHDVNDNFDNIKPIYIEEFIADTNIQSVFPWNEYPYYHNLYPLLPLNLAGE